MELTLLSNAGLALSHKGSVLLIDVPNGVCAPFHTLDDGLWQKILAHEPPYYHICGLYFTHDHPDHFDREKVDAYCARWPQTPVFLPEKDTQQGTVVMGPFIISYGRVTHAPLDGGVPPHVVTWITAGEKSVYIAADAVTDVQAHMNFLKGRRANAAFWNSMYLSQPQTRQLLQDAAAHSYIYHMPAENPDGYGLWRKCRLNFQRYGQELTTVTVLDRYPCSIAI